MSHIHIVEPYHSKAMLRMSDPLTQMAGVTCSETIDLDADLNYHIPWHGLAGLTPTKSKQGMLYTHLNPGAKDSLISACNRADFVVTMSKTGATELLNLGIPAEKITVIYAGHAPYYPRRRQVGIIGYEQPNGRKRSHILLDLCWLMDVTPFTFVFSGAGFDDLAQKMANAGASVMLASDIEDSKMADLYNSLDLLLVTSYVEGGPLTVLDALAAGVPVIAPPVGYANDLLPEDCIYYSIEGLIAALENFVAPITERQKLVSAFTWQSYAEKHMQLFESVLCPSINT